MYEKQNEKYQSDYPNSHYLSNLNNLNKTNQSISLNRLPTLGEILANKTKSPVDLFTFYLFMRDVENKVDYVDFWFDLINHLNLCKHYIKGLRESIIRQSTYSDHTGAPTSHRQSNYRDSQPILDKSKHKSLSSSILLDLIINDNILEDNDSNRLSQFLRGDLNIENLDPKLKDLIEHYHNEENEKSPVLNANNSPSLKYSPNLNRHSPKIPSAEKRISSNSRLLDDEDVNSSNSFIDNQLDIGEADRAMSPKNYVSLQNQTPESVISPSLLEKLIKDSPGSVSNSFITRDNLKESTHNLLLKYFVEDSEKNLNLPHDMNSFIIKAIENDGRDDPDVFNHVKSYVFNKIENDHLPKFLNFMAIRNINHSNLLRIIIGFFFLFVGFWISFIFVFLDYRKGLRPVIIVPYLIAFYCLVSSIYLIDPVLVWLGYSESFSKGSRSSSLIKVRETFIRKLLLKRSLWVLFLILLCTAVLTILFSLVPGHRL
ncbi:uncharacterized protein CANTADRAFT_90889 [Suhomyces tanzawaensis NRRL Y-17324]|uniref:RGS domain-containing protein n=1 Tax=Suhomyces tanzawaensis NRRL Y-17324 TaxID=984487 RepID=A0A1E4SGC8_9ASCO|nr:uncharacterized protein CANTADRAFT_90889 [Suhomyces tanzawaensis NRRL Y-17324]ODV78567.1 hypothetical protein CANTADRAFT_90889 [Suhomyces tanzawaensis NRRL Y-17324]